MALASYITPDDADDEMPDDDRMALASYITPDDDIAEKHPPDDGWLWQARHLQLAKPIHHSG